MTNWLIGIGEKTYQIHAGRRETAIRRAWKRHKGSIGMVIDTRRFGESDDDSVPWRSVDVAYRILGDYALAKKLDERCVEMGWPSVLPPLI